MIDKRLSITSIDNILVICEEGYVFMISKFNNEWGKLFNDYDLIEVFKFISLLTKDPLNLLSYKYALDFKGTELYVGGNIRRLCFFLGLQ